MSPPFLLLHIETTPSLLYRIVAITTGFGLILVFLFVPESFWDRTPRRRQKRPVARRSLSDLLTSGRRGLATSTVTPAVGKDQNAMLSPEALSKRKDAHVGFAEVPLGDKGEDELNEKSSRNSCEQTSKENGNRREGSYSQLTVPAAPDDQTSAQNEPKPQEKTSDIEAARPSARPTPRRDTSTTSAASYASSLPPIHPYTRNLQTSPPLGFSHSLQLFHGRLSQDKWLRVLVRPFILFAYPAVLWSAMVYALSVGWLIVLSEAVAEIFRDRETYNFSALGTGLVYISPFVGGIVGTVVAGKFSDVVVRFMTRRNGGIYEPEFRLVMAVPITLTTAMGLMGFGWSAQERDRWIVPTVFFGILSFGCSVGSTTAITFCVDSYRQYAGEALVTLNFSKSKLPTKFLSRVRHFHWQPT